jgi:hypothetical protein
MHFPKKRLKPLVYIAKSVYKSVYRPEKTPETLTLYREKCKQLMP